MKKLMSLMFMICFLICTTCFAEYKEVREDNQKIEFVEMSGQINTVLKQDYKSTIQNTKEGKMIVLTMTITNPSWTNQNDPLKKTLLYQINLNNKTYIAKSFSVYPKTGGQLTDPFIGEVNGWQKIYDSEEMSYLYKALNLEQLSY